jgi:hypothetical protein
MSYYTSVLKDSPIGFWKLDEPAGSTAFDSSGCGNNGSYVGGLSQIEVPLVPNGIYATKVTDAKTLSFPVIKDFSGQTGKGGFGIIHTEDNDFSLELWFDPKDNINETQIFADNDGTGIYWENGNIVFRVESETLDYVVPSRSKSFYVVATYSPGIMKLYVDGILVVSKKINKIQFANEELNIVSGPAENGKYFLIDAPAIYRYCLSDTQIKSHYSSTIVNSPVQVVTGSFGELFKATIQHQDSPDKFIYPVQKEWSYFANDDLVYRESSNSLYLNPSSSYGEFVEEIFLISWKEYVSSKIEWFGGEGISVYFSITGEEGSWVECTNGSSIPGIDIGQDFPDTSVLFFKVTFISSNTERYLPELYYLGIFLYEAKKLYSHNGESFISADSYDIDISNREYPILSRNFDNGIRSKGGGFYIETENDIYNIEMIITPTALGAGYLFYNVNESQESYVSWDSVGAISKSNISSIYLNGHNISSAPDVSEYINIGEPNYILITTTLPVSGQIWVNAKSENLVRSGQLPDNLYNIIAIYGDSEINQAEHYLIYTGQHVEAVQDSGMSVTEKSVDVYADDWVSINN